MKMCGLLVLSSVLLSHPGVAHAEPPRDDRLRQELLRRMEADQEVRKEFMSSMDRRQGTGAVGDTTAHNPIARKLGEIDRANTEWMKEIIEKFGWPGKSLVGPQAAHAAWLLVQHADHDPKFQKRCLILIADAVQAGDAAGEDLAYLTDRVRIAEKKEQLYGTQLHQVNGNLQPLPIEDETNVDKRRREVGLPSLAEYLAFAETAEKTLRSGPHGTATAAGQSEPSGTYPQLISVRQTDRASARPAVKFDFIDATKLPPGAKALSAAKSANGTTWVVTDKGAFRSQGDRMVPLDTGPKQLEARQPRVSPGLKTVAVAADKLGHIWLATESGLIATDGNEWWQPLDRKDGVPYDVMTCLHVAPNGDLWGGTREGAWRLRDGNFRYFWGKRWLPGNHVRAIWSDESGRTWFDTDGGLATIEERPMTLAQKAAHFDEIVQKRHMRRGFINEIHLKVPGDPSQGYRFEISDNDGLWNAIYVGAMVYRYAATKDPSAKKQARVALDAMLELERLTGIPGYPARAVVSDDDLKQGVDGVNLDETVRVRGETDKIWFRSPVDPTVLCKDDTSSDELDGHYFAWYLYHDLAADEAEKAQIAAIVRRATDHILAHDLTLVGHTGRKTRWGVWSPAFLNHDPSWSPERPLNSLEILSFLKVAEHITGDAKYARVYDDLIEKHHYLLNSLLMRRGVAGQWMHINHSDDELLYLVYYPLLMLEKDPDHRRILVESISRTWEDSLYEQTIRAEHSPLYNFIYGATTGKPCDVESAVATLQDWPWDMLQWTVNNRHRHDVQAKSASNANRSRNQYEIDRVLPASERRLARWNSDPFAPDGGDDGRTEDDGAAWALAYWMGVYHGYLK